MMSWLFHCSGRWRVELDCLTGRWYWLCQCHLLICALEAYAVHVYQKLTQCNTVAKMQSYINDWRVTWIFNCCILSSEQICGCHISWINSLSSSVPCLLGILSAWLKPQSWGSSSVWRASVLSSLMVAVVHAFLFFRRWDATVTLCDVCIFYTNRPILGKVAYTFIHS